MKRWLLLLCAALTAPLAAQARPEAAFVTVIDRHGRLRGRHVRRDSDFVASQFEDDLGCLTPARVLIRVRAVFPGRASLRLGTPVPSSPRVWYAIAPVDKGEIAVRTTKGKPIAYESFSSKTGKARLFTRGSCG